MARGVGITRRDCLAGALAGLCALPGAALARSVAGPGLPDDRAAAIDALLREAAGAGMFDGVVKIERGGALLFDRSYGHADHERRDGFAPATIFRIASLSKNMTNAALAAMAERGELGLDDRLDRYLPHFPSADRITLDSIVRHRSGIPHTNDQPWGDGSTTFSHDELLERLAALPLAFEPGERRSYSNGGYAVLARVMELVRNQPYPILMEELLFAPLGMAHSGVITDSRDTPAGWAKGYAPGLVAGSRQPARYYAAETRPGGGSLYASAEDVLRFFGAAWRGRLPGAARYPALFGGDGPRIGADGRAPGFYMDVHYVRTSDMIVSSTANNYAAEFRWAENIARIALGEQPLFGRLPHFDLGRGADPAWPGRFRNENAGFSQHLEIRRTARDQLVLHDHDSGDARAMIPLREGGYLDPLYYWVCRRDEATGNLRCAPLYEGGFGATLIRTA